MTTSKDSPSRQGLATGSALVCLLIATSLVVSTTRVALRTRRELSLRQQLRQTDLLLDAGVPMAMIRAQASKEYKGEIWRPDATTRYFSPTVEIRNLPSDGTSETRAIEVVAKLSSSPLNNDRESGFVTQRSHQFTLIESKPFESE